MENEETQSESTPNKRGVRTVRLVGVDEWDLSLWDDAWRSHPERMSWARMSSCVEQKNGRYTVILEVDENVVAMIADPDWTVSRASDRVWLCLSKVAEEAWEDELFWAEVMSLPEADDGVSAGTEIVEVEWSFRVAACVSQCVHGSSGEVAEIQLHRTEIVGETVRLRVRLPDTIRTPALTAEGPSLSARVLVAIETAYRTEAISRISRLEDADEIPF